MSEVWRRAEASRSVFESVAHLFAAAAPDMHTALVEAGPAWRIDDIPARPQGPVVWGNVPAAGGSMQGALLWAARREAAVRDLHRRQRPALRAVHRLPPAVLHSRVPPGIRSLLLGGLLCELGEAPAARVLDRVMSEARAAAPGGPRPRPSRDGSTLIAVRAVDGTPLELRVAALGAHKDPGRNADALETLATHGSVRVPRLMRRGVTAGASWTTETRLSGRVARQPSARLRQDAVEFCAALPRTGQATALRDRMLALADGVPRWASVARQLAERALAVPGVLQHGDFWTGNLLTDDAGHLVGVIDWDTWHPAGIPGVDLLQLEAMERRRRTREDIGVLWMRGIWRSRGFRAMAEGYWRKMGLTVTPETLELLGLDWWSGQLFKRQSFAARPGWLQANLDQVLETVSGTR